MNLEFHHHTQNIQPAVHILSQVNIFHTSPCHFHRNVILPSMSGYSVWSLALTFPHQILYERLLSPIHATWPIYLILLHFFYPNDIWCSLIHYPVTSPVLGPNLSQYPIPKYHLRMFLPHYGRPNFTLIWNNRHSYSFVYLNHHIFGYQTGRKMTLHLMITSIPWLQSALNFFQNVAFICYKFDVWLTVHRSSMWNKKPTRCHLVLYLFLLYKLLNMFRATLCPSSGADDLVVFLHVWCSAVAV